jgi:hypothetical protein
MQVATGQLEPGPLEPAGARSSPLDPNRTAAAAGWRPVVVVARLVLYSALLLPGFCQVRPTQRAPPPPLAAPRSRQPIPPPSRPPAERFPNDCHS